MFYTKKNLQINNFDTKKFNFLKLVEDHLKKNLNCDQVMDFHNYIPEDKMPKDIYEGTAHTYGHDLLYAIDPIFKQAKIIKASNIGFIELYKKFIKYLSEEIFKADIIFQKKPSLRIQYPNYTSYGKFHRDSDYNHPEEEINIWLPITKTRNTASMFIESEVGKKDFKPMNLDFGQYLIFNSELMHGNKVNEEKYTRLSMDFRVMFKADYKKFTKSSATQNIKFQIGEYYDTLQT